MNKTQELIKKKFESEQKVAEDEAKEDEAATIHNWRFVENSVICLLNLKNNVQHGYFICFFRTLICALNI